MLKKLLPALVLMAAAVAAWMYWPAQTRASSDRAAAAPQADAAPVGQLPDTATPLAYTIDLTIDPERDDFSGIVGMQVRLNTASDQIWLHGQRLKMKSVQVTPAEGAPFAAEYQESTTTGVASLRFGRVLQPQTLAIRFDYDAPFDRALNGLYLVTDGGARYAYTQMESHFARKAAPLFDEPRFKVPFTVSLTIRNEHVGIANTPLLSSEDMGNGMKKLSFAPSQPLPTYLLAWAVGNLDVVEWEPIPPSALRDRPIPLRGVASHGKGGKLDYALRNTARILQTLEDYFGIPYPYEKLDILAVPDFESGAMENAGAITYREQLLLIDEDSSLQDKRAYTSVHAHELAHQWFGDLVTMPWWNDIWLNEAFASWMENKVVNRFAPEMGFELATQTESARAMGLDALASMRQIRQPIDRNEDISNAFDGITYSKGAAVIAMFENFVGEEAFQRGVTAYLKKYEWGSATSEQFIASIAEAANDPRVTPAFFSFLTQIGVPEVVMSGQCSAGKYNAKLRQSRYLPVGSAASRDQRWEMPFCITAYSGAGHSEHCTLLTESSQDWQFELASCPSHVLPNADGTGYYRFSMDAEGFSALLQHLDALPLSEAYVLVDNLAAGFRSGTVDVNAYLAALPRIAAHRSREVAMMPISDLQFIREYVIDKERKAELEQFYARLYQPRLDAIGLTSKPGDSAELRLMRSDLIDFLAQTARSTPVRIELRDWGKAYIGFEGDNQLHPEAVPADLLGQALIVASQELDAPFFDALNRQLEQSSDGNVRDNLIYAMARSDDPELASRARDLMLSPSLRTNERFTIAFGQMRDPINADAMFQWFKTHADLMMPMMPDRMRNRMPMLASSYCSPERADEVKAYFTPLIGANPGGERSLNNVLEGIGLCHALVQAQPAVRIEG